MHMDVGSTYVSCFLSDSFNPGCLTSIYSYIKMDSCFLGIAGFYTRLKAHSRRSAGFKEMLRTGIGGRVNHSFMVLKTIMSVYRYV